MRRSVASVSANQPLIVEESKEVLGFLAPAILIQYPSDFSDEILKTAGNFAYPCPIPS